MGPHFGEAPIRKLGRSDFKAIFDASPDAILLVGADGLIRNANPRAEVMFGVVPERNVWRIGGDAGSRSASGRSPSSPVGVPPTPPHLARWVSAWNFKPWARMASGFQSRSAWVRQGTESGDLLIVCVVRDIAQSEVLRRVGAARVLTAESERKRDRPGAA